MYEVYALKYGERDTTKCQFFFRESSHDVLTLHYFVWLILGGPQPILVDTGFLDDDAKARGIRNYVSPAAMVARARCWGSSMPSSAKATSSSAASSRSPALGPLGTRAGFAPMNTGATICPCGPSSVTFTER